MALRVTIEKVKLVEKGVWIAPLTPAEVKSLGIGSACLGGLSIVGVSNDGFEFHESQKILSLEPQKVSVLNIGNRGEAMIMDLGIPSTTSIQNEITHQSADALLGRGDTEFLTCAKHDLSRDLYEAAEKILKGIRQNYRGDFKVGKTGRNFTNAPDNFVAIKIQPRIQALSIIVKGLPNSFEKTYLKLEIDRSPYSSFKVTSARDVDEALKIILASAKRHSRPKEKIVITLADLGL